MITENPASALTYLGSEELAYGVVALADDLSVDELRDMLRNNWTRCEAHRPYREDFVRLFRRAGFVTDTENVPKRVLGSGNVTVYRGNLGEPEPSGIAWTLKRATAEFFCRMAMSPRGMFLGMWRPDAVPTIWQATVAAPEILGYFGERGEYEVVVDPLTLRNVRAIAEAR